MGVGSKMTRKIAGEKAGMRNGSGMDTFQAGEC